MRKVPQVVFCFLLALGLTACGKKGGGDKKSKPAKPSPGELKAKKEAAVKAAKGASIAAFAKHKRAFRHCDLGRLHAVRLMRSSSSYDRKTATEKLKKSRVCLEAWWKTIAGELKPKKIEQSAWMPHYLRWKKDVVKVALPKPKSMTDGKKHVQKMGRNKNWYSLTVPASWKPVAPPKGNKKRRKKKKKNKGKLELQGENVTLRVNVSTQSKPPSVSRVLRSRQADANLLAQGFKVHGKSGVLWVEYSVDDGTELSWYGEIDVNTTLKYGYTASVKLKFKKTDWVTSAQLQQFVDLLASMKFDVTMFKRKKK